MYAVAFDLVVADTERNHPKNVAQAYADIGTTHGAHGFRRVQGSQYAWFEENIEQVTKSGHPDAEWLPKLASVIKEEADISILGDWPAWQSVNI